MKCLLLIAAALLICSLPDIHIRPSLSCLTTVPVETDFIIPGATTLEPTLATEPTEPTEATDEPTVGTTPKTQTTAAPGKTTAAQPTCGPLPFDTPNVPAAIIDQTPPYDPAGTYPVGTVIKYQLTAFGGIVVTCEYYTNAPVDSVEINSGQASRECTLIGGKAVWTVPGTTPASILQCINTDGTTCTTPCPDTSNPAFGEL